MNHLNSILLEGNITNDIRKYDNEGKLSARFTIASDRFYKDNEGEWKKNTLFMSVVCRDALAEVAEEKLAKGMVVRVAGRIKSTMRTDKDGNQYPTFEIVANTVEVNKKEKEEEQKDSVDE